MANETVKCPRCDTVNARTAKFCAQCGLEQQDLQLVPLSVPESFKNLSIDEKLNLIAAELANQRAVQAKLSLIMKDLSDGRMASHEQFNKLEQLIQAMTVEILSGHLSIIQAMQ